MYLNEQIKVTFVIVAACGSIASHDLLSVNLSLHRNMLTDG